MTRLIKMGCLCVYLFTSSIFFAQEHKIEKQDFKRFKVGLLLSHTYIPQATSEGKFVTTVPSFGFDIDYWLNEKIGIGMHNDLELEFYEIENGSTSSFEREYPFVMTFDLIYKFYDEFVFVFGYGVELEPKENLQLIRLGLEYEIELGKEWVFSPVTTFDFRFNNYGTWSIGLGVGKKF